MVYLLLIRDSAENSWHGVGLLLSVLVGPCSLEYSKMKIADHYWTDPTASELIQRHRIHTSARLLRGASPQRPALRVHITPASVIPLWRSVYLQSLFAVSLGKIGNSTSKRCANFHFTVGGRRRRTFLKTLKKMTRISRSAVT